MNILMRKISIEIGFDYDLDRGYYPHFEDPDAAILYTQNPIDIDAPGSSPMSPKGATKIVEAYCYINILFQ